jgi:hypothetical protein
MKVNITLQIKGVPTTFYYINAIAPSGTKCTVYSQGSVFECDLSYEEMFLKLKKENENNK